MMEGGGARVHLLAEKLLGTVLAHSAPSFWGDRWASAAARSTKFGPLCAAVLLGTGYGNPAHRSSSEEHSDPARRQPGPKFKNVAPKAQVACGSRPWSRFAATSRES